MRPSSGQEKCAHQLVESHIFERHPLTFIDPVPALCKRLSYFAGGASAELPIVFGFLQIFRSIAYKTATQRVVFEMDLPSG